jgi:hypothetical protein
LAFGAINLSGSTREYNRNSKIVDRMFKQKAEMCFLSKTKNAKCKLLHLALYTLNLTLLPRLDLNQ